MIEIAKTLANPEKIQVWLESVVRPKLTADVSNYAKGRQRVWLNIEPTLTTPTRLIQSKLQVSDKLITRLQELIEWPFDFCLVTYSGDETAVGITAHRDAGYADYEAFGLHVSGEAIFDYWCGRETFGYGPTVTEFTATDEPTHSLVLQPGQVVRFNCKNLHACSPGTRRWNLNFWKRKEQR